MGRFVAATKTNTCGRILPIGEAAKRLGVHPNRLRAWEKQGLIKPTRLPSGWRRYPVFQFGCTAPEAAKKSGKVSGS
ncbi:MerR family transcriptional regulator [Ammonifex degensii]|uniref:MerR family DNA-binding transcriptional regulator n=1 Tax=Ammonifex degensii TaxID=42838 RepID=UPI001B7FEA3E